MRIVLYGILLVIIALTGCSRKPESLDAGEYPAWMSSNESGLVMTKGVKNLDMAARFLPPQYLAYKDFVSSDEASYDSLLNKYHCGLTFQVILQADKNDKSYGNLQQYEIISQEQLIERTRTLSFGIENFISLTHNEKNYSPVLTNFEGYDVVGNRLSFQVVFIVPEYNCGKPDKHFENVVLTFDDPFWDTGVNNFEFSSASITDLPELKF